MKVIRATLWNNHEMQRAIVTSVAYPSNVEIRLKLQYELILLFVYPLRDDYIALKGNFIF